MSRLIAALRAWPMPAKVVSAALLAVVLVLMVFAAMLASARHAAAPARPTTIATQAPAAGGPYPLPPSTSTSDVPTTRPQRAPAAATPPTNPSATTRPTAMPNATSSTTTTTTTTQGNTQPTYCTARVSDANPAAGAPETVTVESSSPRAPLSLQVLYQTGSQTYPPPGQEPETTDASGHGSVTFVVQKGSKGYPVIVEVNIASQTDECETHFVPSS